MRKSAVLLLSTCFAASIAGTAYAYVEPGFTGPGWYQVTYVRADDGSVEDGYIDAGPFPDEASCKATLKADITGFDAECIQMVNGGEL